MDEQETRRHNDVTDDVRRYLSDHNIAVRGAASFDEAVQDVLRDLCGFSATRRSSDDYHRVAVNGGHDLLLKLFDGQLFALRKDLKDMGSLVHSVKREEPEEDRS